ncbi:hypothetical protein Tco_0765454 [Tanacetum coccineum]
MKAHPKHIDWGKLTITQEITEGYVMPKYGKTNWMENYSWIDIIVDDIYDTFYRDEEEKVKVAKASEDMKLSIMKEKFLAMVESEKAKVKDYTKLVVTDGGYCVGVMWFLWWFLSIGALGQKLLLNESIRERETLYEYEGLVKGTVHDIQNRLGSLEVDLLRAIKAKQVDDHDDDHDDDDLDSLDLANIIKKLEEDFDRLLKAKEAKKVITP